MEEIRLSIFPNGRIDRSLYLLVSRDTAMRAALILPLLFLLAGCKPSSRKVTTSHTGDLGQFILQSVAAHGGSAKATNGLPELQSEWRAEVLTGAEYLDGREQVSIFLPAGRFPQVTGYLAQAFGPPSQPPTSQTNGVIHGSYSIRDIGVGLQFYRDEHQAALILVGDLKK
jgi:hypothetical protein